MAWRLIKAHLEAISWGALYVMALVLLAFFGTAMFLPKTLVNNIMEFVFLPSWKDIVIACGFWAIASGFSAWRLHLKGWSIYVLLGAGMIAFAILYLQLFHLFLRARVHYL